MQLKLVAIAALATLATSNALVPRQEAQAQVVDPKPQALVPPNPPAPLDAATMQQLQQLIDSQSIIWPRPAPYGHQGELLAQADTDSQASKWHNWGGWGWPWWWCCYYPWNCGWWW